MVDAAGGTVWEPASRILPAFVGGAGERLCSVRFGDGWEGAVWINTEHLDETGREKVAALAGDLLLAEGDALVLGVDTESAAKRDSDWIALEIECARAGVTVVFVDIPIEGLDAELHNVEGAASWRS